MIGNSTGIQPPSLKARLKRVMRARPRIWSVYWRIKLQVRRVLMLRFFLYDMRHTYQAMYWGQRNRARFALGAELLFQYHKIEKGLVMPGPRRLFSVEAAEATINVCRRWIEAGHSRSDPVFVGAVETLVSYVRNLQVNALDPNGVILPKVQAFLHAVPERNADLVTPRQLPAMGGSGASFSSFAELALARRSVRQFDPEPVPAHILSRASHAAQLAPSACNRQPCRIILLRDDQQKRALLAYQNGNRGFGHLAPQIAIVTVDESCFFDASERHEPYIDGGLFAMSFILSLRDQGVGSCCLNWCVPPSTDRAAHLAFDIVPSQRIVMLIAIGFEPADCLVPQSARRAISEVLSFR